MTSRYSLLTNLNKVCGPLQLGINFKRLVGLKISLVKFTYPMGISGLGGGGRGGEGGSLSAPLFSFDAATDNPMDQGTRGD